MPQDSFFDFRAKLVASGSRRAAGAAPADPAQALTVTQLTGKIEAALRSGVPGSVTVRGEVSNFNHHRASGHSYFTLKDTGACIDCVMFRGEASRIKFTPTDGMELLATGSVRVYAQRGRYQLYATALAPLGQGALELAFQQLKEKLEREGQFDPERKRPIPRYPRRIALVTSRQTAAAQDMLKVLGRFPFLQVSILHVPVQGEGSAALIAETLRAVVSGTATSPDLVLLARGGGSLEDLWSFNEEVVARAVGACAVPVITGIGHEVDVSIADLVADYHAHTPTEAAQVTVSHWRTAGEDVLALSLRLRRSLNQSLQDARQRLRLVAQHELFRRPTDLIDERRQWLDDRQRALTAGLSRLLARRREQLGQVSAQFAQHHPRRLVAFQRQHTESVRQTLLGSIRHVLERCRHGVDATENQLRAVSPQSTLGRGYSITTRKDGTVVRSSNELTPGDVILSRFADGQAESVVRDQTQLRLFE